MIQAVTIKNFKNIKEQRIELDRLTVLVGANGSGKTSVLEAIACAIDVHEDDEWEDYQGRRLKWMYTREAVGDFMVGCETERGYSAVEASASPWRAKEEPLEDPRPGEWLFRFLTEGEAVFEEVQSAVSPLLHLRLNATRLAAPSYSEFPRPRLKSDGSGAASVLAFMALNDPDTFAELTN